MSLSLPRWPLLAACFSLAMSSHAAVRVITWVPPYGVEKSKQRLDETYDGAAVKDGITHLALQFWVPTPEGGIGRPQRYGKISDETITALRDWAHARGIRVLLCLYNGENKWDWDLAKAGFVKKPLKFADALVEEATRLGLDGVDIDLEGNGKFDSDEPAFTAFIRDLSGKLHAKQLELTVDTFCDQWNAPSVKWWPNLLPHVDALTTMGYQETGAFSKEWRAYDAQKKAAGEYTGKLLMGVPASKGQWQEHPAGEHLQWLVENGVGAAIWDAQLPDAAWRTGAVWKQIQAIAGKTK